MFINYNGKSLPLTEIPTSHLNNLLSVEHDIIWRNAFIDELNFRKTNPEYDF